MLWDRSHNFMFHSPFEKPDWAKDPQFDSKYDVLKGKFDHFVKKFRSLPDQGRAAFFYRTDDKQGVLQNAIAVRDLLDQTFPQGNYELIILQDRQYKEDPWPEKHLHNRYLARMAPWADATDGHVSSWDAVFREFPANAPMRLAGY